MNRDGTRLPDDVLDGWLEDPSSTPEGGWSASLARELAWALKTRCYALWSSEPAKALAVADATARLNESAGPHLDEASKQEVAALAQWVWAIACAIQGDMPAAARALDDAASRFHALGQRHHAAQTQVPKVMALAMMGQREAAAQCALAAKAELLACGDQATAAKVLLNLGNLCLRADQFTQASVHFQQASELFSRLGLTEQEVMASLGLADTLVANGLIDQATAIYVHARATAQAHGHVVLEAIAGESMALMDLLCGRYAQALGGLKASMDRYVGLGMPQHLAIAQKQLGDAYLQLRLLPECLRTYADAQARFEELDMPLDAARANLQYARALAQLGKPSAAGLAFEQARARFAQCEHPSGAAVVDLARAELALAQGQAGPAVVLAQAASGYFSEQSWVAYDLQAQAILAQAMLQQGRHEAALDAFDNALARAGQFHLLPAQLRCLTGRGLSALSAGRRAQAAADLQRASEWLEDQRRTLPGDEIRSAFQNQHLALSQGLLRLALDAHAQGQADAGQVLLRLDNTRARTLFEHLDTAHGPLVAPASGTSELEGSKPHIARLRSQLAWFYRRLRENGDGTQASESLVAQLRRLEDELLEQSRRERLAAADLPNPAAPGSQWQVASLQRALAPKEALVAYGVLGDELFACVVTARNVEIHRDLASWAALQETIRAMRFQVEALCHGNGALRRHLPEMTARTVGHLQRLHQLVWAPLAPCLGTTQHVVVVPHGMLSMVPFAALHDGQAYLVEAMRFSVAPSARLALRALSQPPRRGSRVLALADTASLGHAEQEVAQLRALTPGLMAFEGAQATGAHLRLHGPQADVIHLACHAQFRSDNPLFSALHLADGAVTAEEIGALRLTGAHVVLSACETALSDHREGEELLGLPRAFLRAGASGVLASLWPVDDQATAELMAHYHQGLATGLPPSAALQGAQRQAWARNGHPFYWAGFTLIGRG